MAYNEPSFIQTGPFTPVLNFGGGSTGITYTTQIGEYTKIGNVVFYNIFILLSSKGTDTGAAAINGLPFTSANNNTFPVASVGYSGATGLPPNTGGYVVNNSTSFQFISTDTGSASNPNDGNFTDNTQLQITGMYWTT